MPIYHVECINREAGERFGFDCEADSRSEAKIKARAHNLDTTRIVRVARLQNAKNEGSIADAAVDAIMLVGTAVLVLLAIGLIGAMFMG